VHLDWDGISAEANGLSDSWLLLSKNHAKKARHSLSSTPAFDELNCTERVLQGHAVSQSHSSGTDPPADVPAAVNWAGVPIRMTVNPAELVMRDCSVTQPIVALAVSARGQRWYTNSGRTQSLYTAPGMIELYADGFGLDQGRWQGEGGHVIVADLPATALQRLLHDDGPALCLGTHNEVFDPQLENILRAMWDEAGSGAPNGALYAQGLTLAMLGILSARYGPSKGKPVRKAALGREQCSRVLAYVEQHLSEVLSVEQMADLAGMSSDRFARAFKTTYGVSPHAFVLERRLEVARHMLRERKDLSIAQVTALTGFSSQAHFTEMFRRKVGNTPARWRKAP
jgi:AraC family transcriptional regulator